MNPALLTLAGNDVLLAARRPGGLVLVCYADRGGHPTDRFREAAPHELRGIGVHLAELTARIARLPLAEFPFDTPPAPAAAVAPRRPRPSGYLSAHFSMPKEPEPSEAA